MSYRSVGSHCLICFSRSSRPSTRHHQEEETKCEDVNTVKIVRKQSLESREGVPVKQESQPTSNDAPRIKFICGANVLESFSIPNLWKQEDITEIVGKYGLVCITRQGYDVEKFIYQSDILWKYRNNNHLVTVCMSNEISSTGVRRALRRGLSVKYHVPDPVVDYIHSHHLYSPESKDKNTDIILAPLQRCTETNPDCN